MGGVMETVGGLAGGISGGMFDASGAGEDLEFANDVAQKNAKAARGEVRGYLDPYAEIGEDAAGDALKKARKGFSFGAKDFRADPGYAFARDEGLRATQNAAGTRGSPFGGQAMKEMAGYASGLAGQQFAQREQSAFARWQAQIGNLQQLAGLGGAAAQAGAGNMANIYGGATAAVSGNQQTAAQTKGSFMDMF